MERGGAELLVLCTDTMHKVAPAIEAAVSIPLLHIADATADAIRAEGIGRAGLLGTRFTMEDGFYRDRLRERHGLEVLVPGPEERAEVHRVIYEELCLGEVRGASREIYRRIITGLAEQGAEGIILGSLAVRLVVASSFRVFVRPARALGAIDASLLRGAQAGGAREAAATA